jgi:hypothetical protein
MAEVVFQDGTLYEKNKLDMINRCLFAIGEAPYPDGTFVEDIPFGTDGDMARREVENTMVEVQTRGWFFNTDYDFKLIPDEDSFISLPPSALRLDSGNKECGRYILRNQRVYDMQEQTFVIDKEYIEVDMVWLIDYENLPVEAYEYISARAARKFQQRSISSPELATLLEREEVDALTNLMRSQLQANNYKLGSPKVLTRIHNGYIKQGLYRVGGRRDY